VRTCLRKYRQIQFMLFVFFGLSVAAQCLTFNQYKWPQSGEWFPFTRWAMFAGSANNHSKIAIYEWQGVTETGDVVPVNPAHLYVTTNAVGHFTKTKALGRRAVSLQRVAGDPVVDAYAQALVEAFNEKLDTNSLVSLLLWRRSIPVEYEAVIPQPYAEIGSEVIYVYDVSVLKQDSSSR